MNEQNLESPDDAALVDATTHYEISCFLSNEAALLDAGHYSSWMSLLTEDIRYRMPISVTVARGDAGAEALGGMAHFDEDYYSLDKRVARLQGDHAWAEDPRSRTRRFITNQRGFVGSTEDEYIAYSYLLVFRSRLDVRPPEWVSAQRRDVLRKVGTSLRLARRDITIDEAVLRTQNLAIFL
ncbi:MAG TPA: 3-phenylpropionate/cinnamic acid dioxygenase subunit beta [Acidimicrobiales bacterium]|nr:3-phenylpropionate/cinnamic acid dioxygenase subunit beta [Acidimicrobiales bacterium]